MLNDLPDNDIMYEALVNKDTAFEGIFVAAIKTTGIFCRPTCTARKPKKDNVVFFTSPTEALRHGYRPCKICTPMQPKGCIPDWLRPLLNEVSEKPETDLRDDTLRQKGYDPVRVRRWFKKNYDMTFQSYARMHRISNAFEQIKYGNSVTDSAFNAGYDSLSGFGDYFKKITGHSPVKAKEQVIINITRILTPLGPMVAGATDQGICMLEFSDRRMIETQFRRLHKLFNATFLPGDNPFFAELNNQISCYFKGTLQQFDLPLDVPGTPFQKAAWNILLQIPYGETLTYARQAELMQKPTAVRAVAQANGVNRIAILIPCHRVIGTSGSLTGYAGGLWRKKYLLDLEAGNKGAA